MNIFYCFRGYFVWTRRTVYFSFVYKYSYFIFCDRFQEDTRFYWPFKFQCLWNVWSKHWPFWHYQLLLHWYGWSLHLITNLLQNTRISISDHEPTSIHIQQKANSISRYKDENLSNNHLSILNFTVTLRISYQFKPI